ncbi:MAG TPA: lamin tail domain-containing protein, partial [Anaerolineaceae bacterium]|nr:lamin tail domain-containing protein [Anaerolineaceae bacterium]
MSRKVIYILTIFAMVLGMIGFQPVQPVYAASNLRISQISGVGGLDNSPYKEKFIELFNAGSTDASLAGLSLQYAAASSLNFGDPLTSLIELPSDIIPAGG